MQKSFNVSFPGGFIAVEAKTPPGGLKPKSLSAFFSRVDSQAKTSAAALSKLAKSAEPTRRSVEISEKYHPLVEEVTVEVVVIGEINGEFTDEEIFSCLTF